MLLCYHLHINTISTKKKHHLTNSFCLKRGKALSNSFLITAAMALLSLPSRRTLDPISNNENFVCWSGRMKHKKALFYEKDGKGKWSRKRTSVSPEDGRVQSSFRNVFTRRESRSWVFRVIVACSQFAKSQLWFEKVWCSNLIVKKVRFQFFLEFSIISALVNLENEENGQVKKYHPHRIASGHWCRCSHSL